MKNFKIEYIITERNALNEHDVYKTQILQYRPISCELCYFALRICQRGWEWVQQQVFYLKSLK